MWARMCKGAAGIDDFPIWVQLIPRVIFNVICSKEGGLIITRSSLRNFYENFTGLSGDTLDKVATEGFRSMTANGDYELDYSSYKLLFSNFLLGRTIYGPGKYVFGCFDNSDMTEKYNRLQRLRTQMLPSTMQEYQKHNASATRLNARLL